MSAFTGSLAIKDAGLDFNHVTLLEPLIYAVGHEDSERVIVVPIGFATDGASIPQSLQSVLPKWGRHSRAAVVHDYLYALIRNGKPHPLGVTRKAADDIFYEALLVSGVARPAAWAMWAAVRAFGKAGK